MFRIEPFTGTGNIAEYLDRLKQTFIVNDLPDLEEHREKRKAILLSSLSAEIYSTLTDICSPVAPSSKTYVQITDILKERFEEKRLVIAESYRFNEANQGEGESVTEFGCRLQKLASSCNFGDFLARALRDRFVSGIRNASIQGRLLSKEHTFEEALKEAQAMELAQKDLKEMQKQASVHKIRQFSKSKSYKTDKHANNHVKACYHCDGKHLPESCYYKDSVCHYCTKPGHIVRACLKKKRDEKAKESSKQSAPPKKKENIAKEHGVTIASDSDSINIVAMSVNSVSRPSPIMLSMEVNTVPMELELDTGAAVSLISSKD